MGIIFCTYEIKKQTGKFYGIVLDKSLYLLYNINKENFLLNIYIVKMYNLVEESEEHAKQ